MQTITISTSSEHLSVSQNGNQPQPPSSELEKLLQANTTLAVWLIFLAIGGGLLARYYLRINYLPDMEWNAALVYLFVCSVWGGVIGLLLTMSLYLPGVIWSELIIFETRLDDLLTYTAEHDEPSGKQSTRKEPCIRSIMRYLGVPFSVALVASHLCLRFSKEEIDVYWVFAALILVWVFFYMRGEFRRWLIQEKCAKDQKTRGRQIFRYSIWFTISVLLNQIAMYMIYRLADRTPALGNFVILTGICTAGVWISTNVVAVRHRDYPRQAFVAALLMAVVLLFWVDRFSDLAMKLMSRYGVGEDTEVRLVVNDDGSKVLEHLGFAKDTRTLERVNILSKMGDHYFVKLGAHSFTIPKSDVESIHRYDKPRPTAR